MNTPEINADLTTSLASASNIAGTLIARIREAHSNACREKSSAAERLLENALLDLITESCELQAKLAEFDRIAKEAGKAVEA